MLIQIILLHGFGVCISVMRLNRYVVITFLEHVRLWYSHITFINLLMLEQVRKLIL